MKHATAIAALTAALLLAPRVHAAPADGDGYRRAAPWSERVLELAAELPVQDGGRVKPLATYAGFQLLKTNGHRSAMRPALGGEESEGERLTPVAWLLDCLFFPEDARRYPTFLVQDSAVLVAIGVEGRKKRDRYTFEELAPGLDRLYGQASQLAHKEMKDLDALEAQTLQLAKNVRDFESLVHSLDLVRHRYATGGGPRLKAIFGGADEAGIAEVLGAAPDLRDLAFALSRGGDGAPSEELGAFTRLQNELEFFLSQRPEGLAFFAPPPSQDENAHYSTPSELVPEVWAREDPRESPELAVLASLERMAVERGDAAAFEAGLADLHGVLSSRAGARGDFAKIPMENSFYSYDFFFRALLLFLASFVLVALTWLRPGSVWLTRAVWATLLSATALLVVGVTYRCLLQGRPPVTTLYETILFISGTAVIACMAIEVMTRRRVALATATVLGAFGMFLAGKYEFKEAVTAGDTMPSLVAVLDTNFWLSTHVTTVTLGYSAGLLAAALGHVWIVGKVLGLKRDDRDFYRALSRMIYGVICFGLFFSVVGTILGGIWANYSWGRFWGWDPKENGALLICLWELFILHARLGGYAKQFGLALLSVLGGIVVAFSWWGVNLLGVGLHSYGFTSGVAETLYAVAAVEALVIFGALIWKLVQRTAVAQADGSAAA